LGTLALRQAEGPRRGLPRQRLGHRRQGRPPRQDVHLQDRGLLPDHPPRAGTQLLPARVQHAAVSVQEQRERRLPRGGRRHHRPEEDFDPGPKYHIAANVPYARYFLARILQFQFHRALCRTIDYKGPLNRCSIYDNKEAGAKLNTMLSMGQSRPWPEALEAIAGQKQMDATAILDYFAPLKTWLDAQNKGQSCGW